MIPSFSGRLSHIRWTPFRGAGQNQQQMVVKTEQGGGSDDVPANKRYYEVSVLDIYEDIACARAESYEYVDFLHLAREEGQWVIVNVLWANNSTKR